MRIFPKRAVHTKKVAFKGALVSKYFSIGNESLETGNTNEKNSALDRSLYLHDYWVLTLIKVSARDPIPPCGLPFGFYMSGAQSNSIKLLMFCYSDLEISQLL